MNYKLQDLIDLSAFNEMLESLAALYSFTSAIVDLDGKILLAIGWQDACTMFHRVHPDTAAECRKSDSYLNHHLNEAQPFVTYQCHNGLTDCAIPIIIGGEHLANFFTGQFFFEEPDLSFFKAQAERYGFESDRYLESIRKVPIWTKERLHQHMTVIRSFTDLLADLGTRKLKEMQARESAMQAGTALKQRELQLQRIFDTLLDGFVRTDRFGHIVLVSPSVVPLFGYTSESEMLGMAVSQLYADPDFRIEMLKQLEDSGKLVDVVTEGLRKDGTHFWISMNVQALLDETGRREGTEGIIRDITERKVAEQAYREISEMNRSLLDSIPFGFSIVDEKGYIRYVNDNLLHLSDEDPIGQSCTQFSSPEQNYCKICSLRKGIQVGETITFEGKWRDCDRLFLIHQTGMIYNGEKALMNIFLDITEKRAIEQRLNLLAHSLETISECVTITDTEDRIIYVNDSLLRTYGYSEKELIGQHVSVLRPDSVEFVKARELFMQAPDGSWRGELVNRRKDGSLFPILLSTAVLKDETGSAIALIGVAMDITEMHRYRQELFDSKEQAEAGNRLKTALLNNMSHEIRTPMNAIMGFSELMRNADAEDKLTYSEIIFKCSIDLLNVIDQVMLLSRLQSEKIPQEKSRFPVLNMLQQCSSGFREEARSKGLQWEMVVPPKANTLELYTDEEKVREILICLFSNALKYTQKGFVRVECSKQADAILFSVSDSGMGIQEKERERIFEPFYRGENAISQAIRGVGVGLNIAAILAQLIGAKLSFETEMGKGSRFELSVPLALPKKETVTPPAHRMSDHSLSKLKVLIAEDEHLSYQYLIHLLKGQVQQLDRAQNGQEVLEMVEKSHYDLVLMDIQMPVMDGLEATRQLKRKNPNLLVIAQSAFILPSEQGQAMEAGCDGFVAKPIQKEQLMEMIHRFI